MVAGTYTLRGAGATKSGPGEFEYNYDSPYYDNNVDAMKTAFGYTTHPERCSIGSTASSCELEDLYVYITKGGRLNVQRYNYYPGIYAYYSGSPSCFMAEDGEAECSTF